MSTKAKEYLSRLQWEYFECLVKSRIHTRKQNQKYWLEVASRKSNKIKRLGIQLEVPTIFDNEALHRIYKKSIFPSPDSKLPKAKLSKEEIKMLFKPGRKVTVWIEGEEIEGAIVERHLRINILKVEIVGVTEPKVVSILNVMPHL